MSCPHAKVQQDEFYRTYQEIVRQVMEHENSYVFFRPVDPLNDGAPDYPNYVMRPMSIFTVQEKIDKRAYRNPREFIDDMRQIWTNAKIYNHQTHTIYKTADSLAARFETLAAALPHEIGKGEKDCALQVAVELRFARYRAMRRGHK